MERIETEKSCCCPEIVHRTHALSRHTRYVLMQKALEPSRRRYFSHDVPSYLTKTTVMDKEQKSLETHKIVSTATQE